MMPSAASEPCALTFAGGCRPSALSASNKPAAASAKIDASATTLREADSEASSGTTTSQIAVNDAMPPVHHAIAAASPVSDSDEITWASS